MVRLAILAGLFSLALSMLGAAAVLGVNALSRDATPMMWIWLLGIAGSVVLLKALRLLARFNDPRAWRRPRHTPLSLLLTIAGTGVILGAMRLGPSTSLGTVAVVCAGALLIGSSMLMKSD